MDFLRKPLTKKEVKKLMDERKYITARIPIGIGEMIYNDYSFVFNNMSNRMLGNTLLTDISWKPVGIVSDTDEMYAGCIILEVTGDISLWFL